MIGYLALSITAYVRRVLRWIGSSRELVELSSSASLSYPAAAFQSVDLAEFDDLASALETLSDDDVISAIMFILSMSSGYLSPATGEYQQPWQLENTAFVVDGISEFISQTDINQAGLTQPIWDALNGAASGDTIEITVDGPETTFQEFRDRFDDMTGQNLNESNIPLVLLAFLVENTITVTPG